MAIAVAKNAAARICDYESGFAVVIGRASDRLAAVAALRASAAEILRLGDKAPPPPTDVDVTGVPALASTHRPARVSNVMMGPRGPFIFVTNLDASYEALRTIPDIVADKLRDAEVDTAVILSPEIGGPLGQLINTPNAVVLRAFPMPGQPVPLSWIDLIRDWVLDDFSDHQTAHVRALNVEWEVTPSEAMETVHEAALAGAWCDVVAGTPGERVITASLTFGSTPHISFAVGGTGLDATGKSARANLLIELARELAPQAAYACIDFEPTFSNIGIGLTDEGWPDEDGPPANRVAATLVDEWVPDAYWYQILGPGHVRRLTGAVGEPIGGGRVELHLGSAHHWMVDDSTRYALRSDGWEILRELLVRASQFQALLSRQTRQRYSTTDVVPPTESETAVDLAAAVPKLDRIGVSARPSGGRSANQSPSELASWFHREPHDGHREVLGSTVMGMLNWLGQGLRDPIRPQLHNLVRQAVLTRIAATAEDTSDTEHRNEWLAVDWLVHRQVSEWLKAADLVGPLNAIRHIGPLQEPGAVLRAVDVLSATIDTLGPLFDDIIGDESIDFWALWERASEQSGLVAATQTGLVGIHRAIIEATDLNVVDRSRDTRTRQQLRSETPSLAQATWNSSLHAIADVAWHDAWKAASDVALDVLGSPAFDEQHRIFQTDDPLGAEEAETRGVDHLAFRFLISGRGGDDHPFEGAIRAASSGDAGAAWAASVGHTRSLLGDASWERAMSLARSVVDRAMADAPDHAARATVVSLARETAVLAARVAVVRVTSHEAADRTEPAERLVANRFKATTELLESSSVRLVDKMIAATHAASAADAHTAPVPTA